MIYMNTSNWGMVVYMAYHGSEIEMEPFSRKYAHLPSKQLFPLLPDPILPASWMKPSASQLVNSTLTEGESIFC